MTKKYFHIEKHVALLSSIIYSLSDQPLVLTIASEETEGYLRYIRSAKHYGIDVTTLGLGKPWLGGDMEGIGGGYKVNLLREALEPYKNDDKKIVLFTDSYDVVFSAPMSTILEKFIKSEASVLFGAENYCWPDKSLKSKYPTLNGLGARFLNSGLFMGYASKIYEILKTPLENTEDDQLFYTKAYLDEEKRKNLAIKLDHTSIIFQNLNGAESESTRFFLQKQQSLLITNNFFPKFMSKVKCCYLSLIMAKRLSTIKSLRRIH